MSLEEMDVYYFESGDGITGVWICSNVKIYTLNVYKFLYTTYTSMKLKIRYYLGTQNKDRKKNNEIIYRNWSNKNVGRKYYISIAKDIDLRE